MRKATRIHRLIRSDCREFIADLETPVSTLLKLKGWATSRKQSASSGVAEALYAFLLESVEGGERLGRYSFVGAVSDPSKVLRVGVPLEQQSHAGDLPAGDPLIPLESRLSTRVPLHVPSAAGRLPAFTGGAVGYCAYDCVRHWEPRVAPAIEAQKDTLSIPESVWMIADEVVVFDHVRHTIKVVAHAHLPTLPPSSSSSVPEYEAAVAQEYASACARIDVLHTVLSGPIPPSTRDGNTTSTLPAAAAPPASPARPGASSTPSGTTGAADWAWTAASNVGQVGYEDMVRSIQSHIVEGDIIQAVPSHRVSRPLPATVTALDIYRQLRVVNPSPYMFYLELAGGEDMAIVGASPEMLVKVDAPPVPATAAGVWSAGSPPAQLPAGSTGRKVTTHPIAGTRRRGATPAEDEALAADLLADEKERAEHLMLVDLGRNDVGRVAAPGTVKVTSLMHIERYSHVQHIVSNVEGHLAVGRTAYDAFRSVFPAGTVSGAPKVMALELVARAEPARRGVYAGAVGYIGYSGVLDTAIAIRTLVVRAGVVHLQAGAGIVFDSVPSSEWEETVTKMRATMRAVDAAVEAAKGKGSL